MAIIIPSKYIYGDPQDNKINNNEKDKLEINAIEISPDNDYETTVANERGEKNFYYGEVQNNVKTDLQGVSTTYVAYVQIKPTYINFNLTIPKERKNSYIKKLLTGVDKQGVPDIKFTLYGETGKGTATGQYFSDMSNIQLSTPTETSTGYYSLPENVSASKTVIAQASINVPIYGNLTDLTVTETNDEFKFTAQITSGLEAIKLTGVGSTTINCNGTYERYTPTFAEITVYGDTIGISLKDKTVIVGNANGTKPHSFPKNELLQTSNYVTLYDDNGELNDYNSINEMFNDTLRNYKNGKETISLKCSISDYYDDTGAKVISPNDKSVLMTFKPYDKVIPMVMSADGTDKPMALDKNGNAKQFQVIGFNIVYDGAVWQELFLQETLT